MLIIYRFLINLVFLLSPIILIFRLIRKKEHKNRFKEKFCFFSKTRKKGKVLWFHGASDGEIQSIIPILEKLDKKNDINQILITSNTLSSSKIKKFEAVIPMIILFVIWISFKISNQINPPLKKYLHVNFFGTLNFEALKF